MKIKFLLVLFLVFSADFFAQSAQDSKNVFNELDMAALPGGTYIIGENVQTYTAKRTVSAFFMNKYETPYTLWFQVRKDAEKNGYKFQNPGQEGSRARRGKTPTQKGFGQPVTMISWHDAIVWCNAFSEYCGLTP